MQHDMKQKNDHDCTDCPITSRREFIRDASFGVAAILASIGLSSAASAMPVTIVSAIVRNAQNVTYAIPGGDGVQIDSDNEIILVRWQNVVYAFNLSCPHQRTALRWNAASKQFQCPKHKSKYTPQGAFISGRATRGMDRLAISRQGTNVVVDADRLYQEDENEAEWKAALVRLG
jgi:Rieske Fe-S protein